MFEKYTPGELEENIEARREAARRVTPNEHLDYLDGQRKLKADFLKKCRETDALQIDVDNKLSQIVTNVGRCLNRYVPPKNAPLRLREDVSAADDDSVTAICESEADEEEQEVLYGSDEFESEHSV